MTEIETAFEAALAEFKTTQKAAKRNRRSAKLAAEHATAARELDIAATRMRAEQTRQERAAAWERHTARKAARAEARKPAAQLSFFA